MATMGKLRTTQLLSYVVLLLILAKPGIPKRMPDKASVESWAKKINDKLSMMADNMMGYKSTSKLYENYDKKKVSFESVKSSLLLNTMSSELGSMLGRKMKALENSVKVAEQAASDYDFKKDLKLGNVYYWNAKDKNQLAPILEYDERFKQPVNTTVSSVHIPVEIYEGDINILNGLQWSADLDTAFKENYQKDDTILWQYFGSQTGFMRTFPASEWKTPNNEVDLYDVRRRPWYTQGSSSPKDMLILIDKSGSVHGKTLQLIKVAVKSILDTLGENDFVQIVKVLCAFIAYKFYLLREPDVPMFSSEASVVSCFKTFVQANYRNKKIMSEAVDKLEAKEMADFRVGLNFAFDQFEEFENTSREGEGAHCNKMIMLLTDGGTDTAEDVFRARNFNRPEKEKIRVFTYAVGQTANPIKDIKWMACANKGRFEEIPAMGAIRAKVQDYVEVVARPLALKHIELAKWTSSYTGSYKNSGLGMMTTVTLPVYDRSKGASNQTILGVMGIDVTTEQMEKFSPKWKLGPNGYTFAINTNGYVIFHPLLKIHGYLKDPPNMDLLDLEVEGPQTILLRNSMINMTKSSMKIRTYVVSADERHVDHESREYLFTSINGTNFSLGLSLPSYQHLYAKIKGTLQDIENEVNEAVKSKAAILLAPWDYYTDMQESANLTGYLTDLLEALQTKGQSGDWEMEKLRHLYWDLNQTKFYVQYAALANDTDSSPEEPVASFVGTYGGLTLVYPPSKVNLMLENRDTWKAVYYRRSIDMSNKFLFSAEYTLNKRANDTNMTNIMIARAIEMDINGQVYKPAVVGAFIQHEDILRIMESETKETDVLSCTNSDEVMCYLLDGGAFLIASNQQDKDVEIGRFFGHVDAGLMSALNGTVFLRLQQYDYQATCTKDEDEASAGVLSFRIPSINLLFDLLTINWWTSFWTWSAFNFNFYNWIYPQTVDAAAVLEPVTEADTVSCIKKKAQYYVNPNFTIPVDSTIYPCDKNCTRDFKAVRLDNCSLVLLVVGPECPGCVETAAQKGLIQEPVKDDGPDFCQLEPRYRMNPEPCYAYDEKEDTTACSGPLTHPVSAVLIVIATVMTVISTYVFTDIAR